VFSSLFVFAIPRLYHTSTTLSNAEDPAATPPSLPSVPLVLRANTPLAPPRLLPQIVHEAPDAQLRNDVCLNLGAFVTFTRRGPHARGTRLPHRVISIAIRASRSSAHRPSRNATFEHAREREYFLDFLTACEMQRQ
jgi:hypothetical protein